MIPRARRPGGWAIPVVLLTAACGSGATHQPSPARSGRVVHDVPAEIDVGQRYLFYLHGQIVEDLGVRPEHPEFGVYEYETILDALADRGFTVISEARPAKTDGMAYARKVVEQVRTLLAAGVPPEQVSVVGFSKGGGIAVMASAELKEERMPFVFLGTCVNWIRDWPRLELRGRILSIYEESDPIAGACSVPFSESTILPEFREIGLSIGGGHGAFYRPAAEWVDPVVDWVEESGKNPDE